MLYFDLRLRLIADDVVAHGDPDRSDLSIRNICIGALDRGATSLILVHNHPSGDLTPSKSDIDVTMRLKRALSALNVDLIDHYIVSRTGASSLRGLGLI